MQEYLFNKEELRRLIEESGDDQNRIAVTIDLKKPQAGIKARAVRYEGGKTMQTTTTDSGAVAARLAAGEISACPNPPGC